VEVLGSLGDQSAILTLLRSARSADDTERQSALQSLAELEGAEVDPFLLEQMSSSDGLERLALVETAGRRGMTEAMPQLLEFMTSQDSDLRNVAIDALALTVGADELPQMIDRLIAADTAESAEPLKDALQKACQRMADREAAADVITSRMSSVSPSTRAELLDLLIYVGGPRALQTIGTAARSDDTALADSATQALGKWLTPDVAPVLLELAKNGREEFRVRCLRGYIRVIRQFGLKTNERLKMSKQAFDAATRDDERKLLLDTYTRFPAPASLNAVTPHLKNPALSADASRAAVMICEKIVNTDRKAVAAVMPKILAAASDPEIVSRAQVVASQAGLN
jgi:HEAT repeat protein